jgi:hypothetical protein
MVHDYDSGSTGTRQGRCEHCEESGTCGGRSHATTSIHSPEVASVEVELDTKAGAAAERRAFILRSIALLCACSLSIGSH